MSEALAGKVALVTGATRGIGRAISLKLANAGCDVAGIYYSQHDLADSLTSELQQRGRRACMIQANVASPESVDEAFTTLRQSFDHLDFVISNAASGVLRGPHELTLKHWRWTLETNAFALHLLAQRATALMQAGGRIIALSSLGARYAIADYAFVGASKAALESLMRSWAQELGPRGIRVNAVVAGTVDTDSLRMFRGREELLATFAARTPAGPTLTAEQVAAAVYLLCLPEAEMINGHTLVVDGGFSISG